MTSAKTDDPPIRSDASAVHDAPAGAGRILLVEDEPVIRLLVAEELETLGFKVEAAASATEAMSKLRLIAGLEAAIIDVGLPDRSGDVLAGEVRAIYPRVPIVIATGDGEDTLRDCFKSDDRITFVEKPYGAEQLLVALASLRVVADRAATPG